MSKVLIFIICVIIFAVVSTFTAVIVYKARSHGDRSLGPTKGSGPHIENK